MKKYIISLAVLLTLIATAYAWTTIKVYNAKTCYTTSADTYDTSNTYSLHYANHVAVSMALWNVDTTTVVTYVDGYISGKWQYLWAYTHIIDKGGASDSAWTSNYDNAWSFMLRGDTTDHIQGVEKLRFRNKIGDMANSTTYTTTGPYYNMELQLRK